MWDITITLLCRYNIFIASHGIKGPLKKPTQSPTPRSGICSNTILWHLESGAQIHHGLLSQTLANTQSTIKLLWQSSSR